MRPRPSSKRPAGLAAIGAVLLLAASSLTLSACSTSKACPSWADFSDPAVAYRDAVAVVVGRVGDRDGTLGTTLGDVRAYRFAVEQVLKGTVDRPQARIGSRADPCDGGDGYANGDALARHDRVLVYLMRDGGSLVTLTPGQGVVGFPTGSRLPSDAMHEAP